MKWEYWGNNSVHQDENTTIPAEVEVTFEEVWWAKDNELGWFIGRCEQDETEFQGSRKENHEEFITELQNEYGFPKDIDVLRSHSYSVMSGNKLKVPKPVVKDSRIESGDTLHFLSKPDHSDRELYYVVTDKELNDHISNAADWRDTESNIERLSRNIGELQHIPLPDQVEISKSGSPPKSTFNNSEKTFSVYKNNARASQRIREILDSGDFSNLYSLDYSTKFAKDVLTEAADKGMNLFALLKNPYTAINNGQYSQIMEGIKRNLRIIYEQHPGLNLNVKLYNQEGAVRARRIDSSYLIIGWYTYVDDDVAFDNKFEKFDEDLSYEDNLQSLWGHSNPMIEINESSPEFKTIINWFEGEVYQKLWESGLTVEELLDLESEYDVENNIRGGESIREWVSGDKVKERKKNEYIREISDINKEVIE